MQMPMYGSPMGYNQPYGGWQAPQQLYQPQTNSFMPKTQNAPDGLNQGYGSMPWIFVSSEEDARNRIVQPNQTAWFMDNNNPYFYVKSCVCREPVHGTGKLRLRHGLPCRDSA